LNCKCNSGYVLGPSGKCEKPTEIIETVIIQTGTPNIVPVVNMIEPFKEKELKDKPIVTIATATTTSTDIRIIASTTKTTESVSQEEIGLFSRIFSFIKKLF
jgi:hypothetical protein